MPCLEITTMVGCPLRCTYCPQDKLTAEYAARKKYLTLLDFETILAKVPKYVRIDFSGMSESWANPSATDMLAHALSAGFNVGVYTTLVGMSDYDRVIGWLHGHAEQVEIVRLHLPDKNGNMRGFIPTQEYRDALAAFAWLGQSGALRDFSAMTMDGSQEIDARVMLPELPFATWQGNARAGSLEITEVEEQPILATPEYAHAVSCSFTPFYDHNVLLPNGDVVLCCMDYSLKHKIGNLLTGDYFSLFASDEMIRLRVENMRADGKSICKNCTRAISYRSDPSARQFWNAVGPVET